MIRKLFALLPLAISAAAFAAESNVGSEYLHQTAAGKIEVTPALDYHNFQASFSNYKSTDSGIGLAAKGEYGIDDMFSAGLILSGAADTWNPSLSGLATTNAGGLNNIDVYGLGKYELGGSILRYGLDFAISTAKQKLDQSSTSTGAPASIDSGATMATPFVGWEMAMGPGILGVKFSYTFMLTNRSFNTSQPNETSVSAESLSAFYEWQQDNWSLGAAIAWNGVNGGTISNGQGAANDGHAGININIYAPITLADNLTLVPHASWGDDGHIGYIGQNLNTWNGFDIGVGARFVF